MPADPRAESDKTTVIAADSEFHGKLTGKDARVLGHFRGDVDLTGRFSTGEASKVEARVKADSAEIAGEFVGEIAVRSLLLTEKARVEGTVQAETLAVREGAYLGASVSAVGARAAADRSAITPGARPVVKGAQAS